METKETTVPDYDFSPALVEGAKLVSRQHGVVTEAMIQAACVAAYGVDTDKDSTLHKLMKRALQAALAV